MQFKTITLTTFIALATAASSSSSDVTSLVSQIPTCASSCLDQGAAAAGCGDSDYSCQCENEATVSANASTCLTSSCSVTDISTTKKVVNEICDAVDGTSSNSTSTSSSSTNSSSTSTGSSSSSSSSSTSSSSSSSSASSIRVRTDLYKGLGWAVVGVMAGMMTL